MKGKFTSLTKIRKNKFLPKVYKDLFFFLAKKNPLLYKELEQMWTEIEEMNFKIDYHAERCFRNIVYTSRLTRMWARKLKDLREKGEISNELYFVLLFWLYQIFQYYGNAWGVLMDGVIFEGILEEEAEKLISQISLVTKLKLLDILDIVESLSFSYAHIPENRKKEACKKLEELNSCLRNSGNLKLAQKFNKFLHVYSRFKYWQVVYAEIFSSIFTPTYDELLEDLSNVLRDLGMSIERDVMNPPWVFIPYVENKILPRLLKLR